jgi:hypothetical protein
MSRDNSGSISKNTRKEKDTHPDLSGKCVIDGKEYWISGWKKTNDSGPWVSLSFKPKEAKPEERSKPATRRTSEEDSAW